MIFYHITPARFLKNILKTGLSPDKSKSSLNAIYLSGSKFTALNYEGMKDEPFVLLEVSLTDSEVNNLLPDNYELKDLLELMDGNELEKNNLYEGASWYDCDWRQSLNICDQVAYPFTIAPSAIRAISIDDEH